MTRFLSFTLLALAAFDWPAPWLDRLGTAALGLAFLSLAVGAARSPSRRSLPFGIPTTTDAVADEAIESAASLAQRIAAYDVSDRLV